MSLDLIKKLRERTGVGMMDCKKALAETGGDLEKAVEILRKKGVAIAAKRSDNETNNGSINGATSDNLNAASLVKVACETDFSANTDDMKGFGRGIAQAICASSENFSSADQTLELTLPGSNLSVKQGLDDLISKIAESIKVAEIAQLSTNDNGSVGVYVHPDHTIGVISVLEGSSALTPEQKETASQIAKDICMHAAVMNPLSTSPDDLDQAVVEKEREVVAEQLRNSGKPENMIEKISEGKIRKYYEEVCLTKQKFVKNDKVSIEEHVAQAGKAAGITDLKVVKFVRFGIGR